LKINSYSLSYTIVAPSGETYPIQEVVFYTVSKEKAIQLLDEEIQRRLGNGYQRHISCTPIEAQEPVQLSLF